MGLGQLAHPFEITGTTGIHEDGQRGKANEYDGNEECIANLKETIALAKFLSLCQ